MITNVAQQTILKDEIDGILRQNQELAVVGQFAAAVMHEINGPLEAVTNLNYLIKCGAEDVDQVRQYSQLIDEQLVTLTKLSRQTLSFYKSAETKQDIAIATLAEAALRVHQKAIVASRFSCVKDFRPISLPKFTPAISSRCFRIWWLTPWMRCR